MKKNDLSNALCNMYDIKKNYHIKKIKNLPLDSDLLDKNGNYEGEVQYSLSDCIDDIIDSLEQLEE